MIGGVVQGTLTKGLWITPHCISRKELAVRISALRMYGTMKMGLSTMGKPKKMGSLIWKIWVGSDRRLTFR